MISRFLFTAMLLLGVSAARAETVSVSLAELQQALESERGQPDSVRQLVLDKIQRELDAADLNFRDGALLIEDELFDQTVEDGCTSTVINNMRTVVEVATDSALSLELNSLFEPLTIQLSLNTALDIAGTARQTFGFRLGSCQQLARDTFTFTADGPLSLDLSIALELNPVWIAEDILRLQPQLSLNGQLTESNIRVDVDDSIIRGLLENFLQDEVEALLRPSRLNEELTRLQSSVNEQLAESLADDNGDNAGILDIELPAADDEQILALYELLTPIARFPLTTGFIRDNRFELLAALLLDDNDSVEELLQSAAECQLTTVLQTGLAQPTAYSNNTGACVLETDFTQAGTLYADASCTTGFDFYPTSLQDFCTVALSSELLGNGAANSTQLQRWTLSPGTRFDVGALSISGKPQPYIQRVSYKQVQNEVGTCDLEMRVYSSQPAALLSQAVAPLKPLIALHGGSWQYRGTGFLGVENMATHFTDAGFVVFAPFYRLVGDSDGTAACQQATLDEIVDDVNDALAWVNDNQQAYGASGKPVLFGQSAGGHLAASLAINQPELIERSVLFYAPVDFRDFAIQLQSGADDNAQGSRILEAVTGQTIETLDLDSALVANNSFPSIVAAQPQLFPPFFMLHGESDSLLPSRQSERLCDALSGQLDDSTEVTQAIDFSSIKKSSACDDRGSQLHLIAEGEHTLDLCISSELCLSGSPASAEATADVIQSMIDWSAADSLSDLQAEDTSEESGGGSGRFDPALALVLAVLLSLRRRVVRAPL